MQPDHPAPAQTHEHDWHERQQGAGRYCPGCDTMEEYARPAPAQPMTPDEVWDDLIADLNNNGDFAPEAESAEEIVARHRLRLATLDAARARPDGLGEALDIYPGPSFIDGLLARCGVYWGEDPMADPDDERRHWWMGTDGAGSVWAIDDEITIALIQQFTRVLANIGARMDIAAERTALASAPAPEEER